MDTSWTSQFIKFENKEIFYTRTGDNKPPIILAHGFTDDGLCWTDVAKDLQANYDLIMFDAIGHGQSSRLSTDVQIDMVNDLRKVITTLNLQKPAIMGHSMGAAVAAGYAATFPNDVSVILLEDVPWFDEEPRAKKEKNPNQPSYPEVLSHLQQGTLEEAISYSRKTKKNWVESIHAPWASSKMKFDLSFFDTKWPETPKWQDLADKITCPTLMLTGDIDKGALVTPAVAIKALRIMPKVQWAHVPGAGHCIRYEKYATFITMVQSFLKREYPPAKGS